MALADLTVRLTADIKDFASGISSALKQADKLRTTLGSNMSSGGSRMVTQVTALGSRYKEATKELKSHNLGLKDTSRIIQGIMVSQIFYGIAGSIRNATAALWDFNVALDYMKVTYSALFGDTNRAEDFMAVLQEHSINTIFDYQGLANASKKLLAYGIEYENLMFIMEGLTNLGAMSGDSAALERISLALGQIYTKGKLSAEEMRQLANAYIPITEILQTKFGLTGDDLKNVGDLGLPAAEVINAIVDYANENFASVGDAAMYTITGLQNKLVDTLKVLGTSMLTPLNAAYKSFLVYITQGLENIRTAYASGGMGGIFEYLVPDAAGQEVIRQFLANIHNLFKSLAIVGSVVKQVFGNLAHVFVTAFNILAPIVLGLVNLIAGLVSVLLDNSVIASTLRVVLVGVAGAFLLLRIQAIGALIITVVTTAVNRLSQALVLLGAIITRHPIISLLVAITAALIGVSAWSDKANGGLTGLFDGLSETTLGTSSVDVLKEVEQTITDSSNAADQFNNRLKESAGAADDLSEAIKGTGKEAKKTAGLLSFDEVFKLSEQKGSSSSPDLDTGGLLGDLEDLTAGFSGLGDALIPEIPDFTDFINGFTDDLFGGLFEKIKTIASGTITGTLIGALVGFAIGGLITRTMAGALAGARLGSGIGAAAGAGFAALWPDIYKRFEKAISNIAVGAGAGAIVGALTGFIIGAFATRTLAGAIAGARVGLQVGTIIGATVGAIFGDASEAIAKRIKQIAAGGAEGMLVGALAGLFIGAFATRTWQGALAGARIGAGLGLAIGGIIGGIFGDAEVTIRDALINMFADIQAASYGAVIGGLVGMIIGAIVGAFAGGIGALPGARAGASLGAAIGSLGVMFSQYLANSGITEAVSSWFSSLGETVSNTLENLGTSISTWWSGLKSKVSNGLSNLWTDFGVWLANATVSVTTWLANLGTSISTWWSGLKSKVSNSWSNLVNDFGVWLANLGKNIGTWFSNLGTNISTLWNGLFDPNSWKSGWESVKKWFSDLWDGIAKWFKDLGKKVGDWWDGLWDGKTATIASTAAKNGASVTLGGHATGGIFNREHIARFAEGNKAEAVIPLENRSAMQPFVDAVAGGLVSSLAPMMASAGGQSNLPPLYVGTLIADDRGIKELYKKFEVIQLQENDRRGMHATR